MRNTIIRGDALTRLRELPDASVHCCVTSPPYWGLRDYGQEGQIGLEDTPEEYVRRLVEVLREVRRTLHPSGTLWLNIGDSYNTAGGVNGGGRHSEPDWRRHPGLGRAPGLKTKDLVGIPWTVALALRQDGWWLRSDIIWAKGNPMPEPVTDRPSRSHEHVFLLTRDQDYFYDQDAVREPHADDWHARASTWREGRAKHDGEPLHHGHVARPFEKPPNPLGRNRRDVWNINPTPYPGAHFATFPEELPRLCILAGTSAHGVCPHCNAPWERAGTGWQPPCACPDNDPVPAVVLDPFAGSGTTLAVAKMLRRDFVGIELNPEYVGLIHERLRPALETEAQRSSFDTFMRD